MEAPDNERDESSANVMPIAAKLVDCEPENIRVGSPFAVDPVAPEPRLISEPISDVGPIRYTAMGAVAASVMVVGFGTAAAWWFPAGGAVIASLGCALSIFGLFSLYRFTSAGLLTVHLVLFVTSYVRAI